MANGEGPGLTLVAYTTVTLGMLSVCSCEFPGVKYYNNANMHAISS